MGRSVDLRGYRVVIEPLSEEDGGGYLATVPELAGCMSDGETPMEALENVGDAIATWTYVAGRAGRSVPSPAGLHTP